MVYKARPITSKACASPLKANEALISGAAAIGDSKRKADYGAIVTAAAGKSDKVNSRRSNYTTFDQTGNNEEPTEKGKGGQANNAVTPETKA